MITRDDLPETPDWELDAARRIYGFDLSDEDRAARARARAPATPGLDPLHIPANIELGAE